MEGEKKLFSGLLKVLQFQDEYQENHCCEYILEGAFFFLNKSTDLQEARLCASSFK